MTATPRIERNPPSRRVLQCDGGAHGLGDHSYSISLLGKRGALAYLCRDCAYALAAALVERLPQSDLS